MPKKLINKQICSLIEKQKMNSFTDLKLAYEEIVSDTKREKEAIDWGEGLLEDFMNRDDVG